MSSIHSKPNTYIHRIFSKNISIVCCRYFLPKPTGDPTDQMWLNKQLIILSLPSFLLLGYYSYSLCKYNQIMREFGRFGPLIGAVDEGTSIVKFLVSKFNNKTEKYISVLLLNLCWRIAVCKNFFGSSWQFLQIFAAKTSEVLTYHQISLRRFSPQEGWIEQDALEILNAVLECIEVKK